MIRRRLGNRWLLFTQDDHARLAADLGGQVGNTHVADADSPIVLQAIALHDAGWPAHDRNPTLNPRGKPLDVFEVTRGIALPVWTASAERAAAADPYAGLLVSLHVLALSAYAISVARTRPDDADVNSAQARFAMNAFQHAQIELQESLRRQLEMPVDRPLKLGLADDSTDPREQQLSCDFRLLQAMDQLSLNLCCTDPPAPVMRLHPRPGQPLREVRLRRIDDQRATLTPWIFRADQIEVDIPCRELPAETFADVEAFRAAFAESTARSMTFMLTRG